MPVIKPSGYNVLIIGHWNLGILSPKWISREMYQQEEGDPVNVLVPLNYGKPNRIQSSDGTIEVRPSSESLYIGTIDDPPTLASLNKAIEVAKRTLRKLPETPIIAAGINFILSSDTITDEAEEIITSGIDAKLNELGKEVKRRKLERTIPLEENVILNIYLESHENGKFSLHVNIHNPSQVNSDVVTWLEGSYDNAIRIVRALATDMLGYEMRGDIRA